MRFLMALWIGKLVNLGCRLAQVFFKRGGSNLPGVVAMRIDPAFLEHVAKPEKILAVTGTNGKTTTTNMLADTLDSLGEKCLCNRQGGNIATGIATCLMSGVSAGNKCKYKTALLEVDERSSIRVYPYVKPQYVLVTNLSRDSMMRNPHPFYIRDIIQNNLPEGCTLILNADDIISAHIKGKNAKYVYYGIARQELDLPEPLNLVNDVRTCPECGSRMTYEFSRGFHFGRLKCPSCGLSCPEPDVEVEKLDKSSHTLTLKDGTVFPMISESMFNISNEAGVIALLRTMGYTNEQIGKALKKSRIVNSRYHEETLNGARMIFQMSKGQNPVACSTTIGYVASLPGTKEVVIDLDDPRWMDFAEDFSYWYDTDFEQLNRPEIRKILMFSHYGQEFRFRMQLGGVPKDKVVLCGTDMDKLAEELDIEPGTDVYFLYDIYRVDHINKLYECVKKHASEKHVSSKLASSKLASSKQDDAKGAHT